MNEIITTKDFLKKLYESKYQYEIKEGSIIVFSQNKDSLIHLADVSILSKNKIKTMHGGFISDHLFELICKYARTPLDLREEEINYYLRLKKPKSLNYDYDGMVLNYHLEDGIWFTGDSEQCEPYQTIFTEKELLELGFELSDFGHCEVGTNEWVG